MTKYFVQGEYYRTDTISCVFVVEADNEKEAEKIAEKGVFDEAAPGVLSAVICDPDPGEVTDIYMHNVELFNPDEHGHVEKLSER